MATDSRLGPRVRALSLVGLLTLTLLTLLAGARGTTPACLDRLPADRTHTRALAQLSLTLST